MPPSFFYSFFNITEVVLDNAAVLVGFTNQSLCHHIFSNRFPAAYPISLNFFIIKTPPSILLSHRTGAL
jgi:hypothetical protein